MRFKLYYFLHFGLIFIISITSIINSFLDFKKFDKEKIVVLNRNIEKILHTPLYNLYTIFTGTNTGYGFYGINVSTYKYFEVEVYDNQKSLIKKTNTFDIKNQNNLARFEVLASKMANFIVESKNSPKDENPKFIKIRKLYINKVFKYIGLSQAQKFSNAKYYTVTLYTLMPLPIKDKNYNTSRKIAPYESFEFEL